MAGLVPAIHVWDARHFVSNQSARRAASTIPATAKLDGLSDYDSQSPPTSCDRSPSFPRPFHFRHGQARLA